MKINILIILSAFVCSISFYIETGDHKEITLSNFTFGSCFYGRESTRLDIFKTISKNKPQLFMWLGDAAYVDEKVTFGFWKSSIDVNFTRAEEIFEESKKNECNIFLN
jgi:hypothetical protein